jgi:hypothetical protein
LVEPTPKSLPMLTDGATRSACSRRGGYKHLTFVRDQAVASRDGLTGIHAAIVGGGDLSQAEWDRLNGLHVDAVAAGRQLVKDLLNQPAS